MLADQWVKTPFILVTVCVGDVCLAGGDSYSGNVYIRGKPVCGYGESNDQFVAYWGWENAQVVCKHLGFSGAQDSHNGLTRDAE